MHHWIMLGCRPRAWALFAVLAVGGVSMAACGKHTSLQTFAGDCVIPDSAGAAPNTLYETGCFSANGTPASRLYDYSVNAALWADDANKTRYLAPLSGTPFGFGDEGVLVLGQKTGVFKEFYLNNQRLETRLLLMNTSGTYEAVTYAWNDAQTQATLVPEAGASRTLADGNTWTYLPRSDCLFCHNATAGTLLGARMAEIDRMVGDVNQVLDMQQKGILPAQTPNGITPWPAFDGNASLQLRARSYLASNCSFCHRPNGASGTKIDFRYDTALADVNVCDVLPSFGQLTAQDANLLTPGAADLSIISIRMHSVVAGQCMPPVGHIEVDPVGTALVDGWINSLSDCPSAAASSAADTGATDPNGSGSDPNG